MSYVDIGRDKLRLWGQSNHKYETHDDWDIETMIEGSSFDPDIKPCEPGT